MNSLSLHTEAKEILLQVITTINTLTYDEYNTKISILSNASIGEHTRHIIELFQQLHSGYATGLVDYDNRKRNIKLQENIDEAIEALAQLIKQLAKPCKELKLVTLYNNGENYILSNYSREIMFNIEHCIHHQALIKVGLLYLNKNNINNNFGVAKATLKYRDDIVMK